MGYFCGVPQKGKLLDHLKNIAFFYPSHFPVKGGSSIHGYYLVTYLCAAGFRLFTFPDKPDSISTCYPPRFKYILKAIFQSDYVYVRVHTEGYTRLLPLLGKIFGKKVLAEINGLPDELIVTKGYSDSRIRFIEKRLGFYLRFADVVIAPSNMLADFCRTFLHARHVVKIENGGEHFDMDFKNVDEDVYASVMDIRNVHKKIALWSGTASPWQGISMVETLAKISDKDLGIIIISNDRHVEYTFQSLERVYIYKGLTRQEVAFIISVADVGMAFYDDHLWCRYHDYYGSSLKYYEYRANGLSVVATPSGHLKDEAGTDVFISGDISEIYKWIMEYGARKKENYTYRSWKDVADETIAVINNL